MGQTDGSGGVVLWGDLVCKDEAPGLQSWVCSFQSHPARFALCFLCVITDFHCVGGKFKSSGVSTHGALLAVPITSSPECTHQTGCWAIETLPCWVWPCQLCPTVPIPWPVHLLFIHSHDPNHPHSYFLCLFHFSALFSISQHSCLPPLLFHACHPILHCQDFPILGRSFPWIIAVNLLEWVMVVKTSPKATDCHCSLEQWGASFQKKVGHWNAERELCSFQRFQELLWSAADALSPGKLSDPWSAAWAETG